MKTIFLVLIILMVAMSCQNNNIPPKLILNDFSDDKAAYQKRIVGQLSGEFELAANITIDSRWSPKERDLTKRYLLELISTLGIQPEEHHYQAANLNPAIDMILNPFQGTNVWGVLPATVETKDYIILGAHYDSGKRNAPGAIDNATGIALIYSVIKELSKSAVRKKNTVIVFFDQEEEELIGSKAFAKLIRQKDWNIHSVHCFDMVGWDENHDGAMEIYSPSEQLIDTYQSVANNHNKPLFPILIDLEGYDNSSTDFDAFIPHGFEAIGAGECYYHKDSTPFKDSPKDTYDTVNFEYLLSCTLMIEDIIKTLVNS